VFFSNVIVSAPDNYLQYHTDGNRNQSILSILHQYLTTQPYEVDDYWYSNSKRAKKKMTRSWQENKEAGLCYFSYETIPAKITA